jgi:hypothetical protein
MDFIIGLLLNKYNNIIYNSILVIINRFIKIVQYIYIIKIIDTFILIEIFV